MCYRRDIFYLLILTYNRYVTDYN